MLQSPRSTAGRSRRRARATEDHDDRNDPRLRRLAVRQRRPARRPPGRRLPAGRHLRPLPPAEGQPRPDGLRLGLARHADHGRGRQARPDAAPGVRALSPPLPGDAAGHRHQLRPVHAHRHREPSPHRPGLLPEAAMPARPSSARRSGSCTPRRERRFLPDRYVEGTCPICGYAERARRPVRQVRQPARRRRPDQPAQQDRRLDAGPPRDRALLPRPGSLHRSPASLPGGARRPLAAERRQASPATTSTPG